MMFPLKESRLDWIMTHQEGWKGADCDCDVMVVIPL